MASSDFKVHTQPVFTSKQIASFAKANGLLPEHISVGEFAALVGSLHEKDRLGKAEPFQTLITQQGELVAYYGACARMFHSDKAIINGALACNLVIKPGVNVPLFHMIQKAFFSQLKKLNYQFAYAIIARDDIARLHRPVGWTHINYSRVYVRPLRLDLTLLPFLSPRLLSVLSPALIFVEWVFSSYFKAEVGNVSVVESNVFGPEFTVLNEKVRRRKRFSSEKGSDALSFRFDNKSARGYRIFKAYNKSILVSYIVLRDMVMKSQYVTAIVDFEHLPGWEDVLSNFIAHYVRLPGRSPTSLFTFLATDSDDKIKSLRRAGFLKTWIKFTLIARVPKSSDTEAIIGSLQRWNYTWFDHDFV
jgi:hypothetical protein